MTEQSLERDRISLLVDARGIYASGIGRYLREVLTHILSDSRFLRVTLAGEPARLAEFVSEAGGSVEVKLAKFDFPFYSPAAQLRWPGVFRSSASDVTFLPHYDGPLFGMPARSVVTVQDLIHFKVPELFPLPKRIAAGFMLQRVCRQADTVLVTSDATAQDLHQRLPFTRLKTSVIPLGVGDRFLINQSEASAASPCVDGRYLLCVGNRKPHKNHVAAVETLARLTEIAPDLKLVVAGRAYDGAEEVMQRARVLGVSERVVEISDPSDTQLRDLYSRCALLLFPSLYEGFGLPLLEAMGCGAPVIASNRSSIPEVAGGAAILVDPHDHDRMAREAEHVLTDAALRERLAAAGGKRAAMLTWTRTASAVADLLVSVQSPRPARSPAASILASSAGVR